MKILDYGPGIYTLFQGALPGKVKVYDGWNHIGWEDVIVVHVMLRVTIKSGYYIIKYIDSDDKENRIDCINDFRVQGKSLKSYLKV